MESSMNDPNTNLKQVRTNITSACSFWFWILRTSLSALAPSNCFLRASYSFSNCLVFHLALLFWNHMAICLGCNPKALANCTFLSGSSLFANSKLFSRAFNCSKFSLFFFSPHWKFPSSDNSSSPFTSSHLFSMPENDMDRFSMNGGAPPATLRQNPIFWNHIHKE